MPVCCLFLVVNNIGCSRNKKRGSPLLIIGWPENFLYFQYICNIISFPFRYTRFSPNTFKTILVFQSYFHSCKLYPRIRVSVQQLLATKCLSDIDCCLTTGGFPRLAAAAATRLGPADAANAAVRLLNCWMGSFPCLSKDWPRVILALCIDLGTAKRLDESASD